jgi:hypothetical protein
MLEHKRRNDSMKQYEVSNFIKQYDLCNKECQACSPNETIKEGCDILGSANVFINISDQRLQDFTRSS